MYSLNQYRATNCFLPLLPPPALTRPEALPTLKAKFYDAVARVVLDQPHMRVGIIDEDAANPYFVRLFRLDLAKHIEWRTIGDSGQLEPEYLQSMQTQLDSRFDDVWNQPGWRIIVLHMAASESIEVLHVWNHPHQDGMSGKIFHQHLLRKLDEGFAQDLEPILKHAEGSNSWLLDLPNDTDRLPPNPEKLSWWLTTPKFFFSALWKELKPPSIFPPGNKHAHWAPVKLTPFTTRFHTFPIDIDTVTKLVNTCREHHTTLTGLTQALSLVSLTSALARRDSPAELPTTCATSYRQTLQIILGYDRKRPCATTCRSGITNTTPSWLQASDPRCLHRPRMQACRPESWISSGPSSPESAGRSRRDWTLAWSTTG